MLNRTQKYESLFELANILGQQNDFEEILRIVSLKATTLFDAEVASIMMTNPGTQNTMKTIMRHGKESDDQRYQMVQTNVIGLVMRDQEPFLSADIKKDSRFSAEIFEDENVRSVICAPLRSEGKAIGCLLVLNKNSEGKFSETDLHLLEKMAAICAPFLSNVQKIKEYFAAPMPEPTLLTKYEQLGLLGRSKKFVELLRAIEAAARCDVRVLLEGQSGTGKELIARAIHKLSARKQHAFIAIDCGAIPDNLLESELFGHVKGAFTGANHERKGLIAEANDGTFFMDEITNLAFDMQAKLLRVLQEGEIRKVGSNRPQKVNVRIISASSAPLRELVDEQRFREDLFYRLHVYPIPIPTLNERKEDIPLLAASFVKKFARQQQKQAESFTDQLLDFLQQRKWTGNIRELENFVERLITHATPEITVLNAKILPAEFKKEFKKIKPGFDSHPIHKSLREAVSATEEKLIRQALIENDWNQSQAARALKISERNIRHKMVRLGIVKPG